ncbi:HdeD family acid-resistance protein [Pseudooceanicola nanhaiensis]|jgi:uncharacterized membrane protein HdeD (DUF308 family)|uniref:HdeD family acid-resistance protein n=1 Tax=Pseudooceanicola nanhaiensis TaxID=375761 RepID=A0A917T9K5_9RHOB|nr:DUF308 domain-containing protein [Pseudooceanicola nanhaiensis]GGM15507.1 hypothetical protein GCM10011534_41970 [Pseudooceanicola nanhaiensis]
MRYWYLWFGLGVLSVVGGVLALFNPFAASVTAEQLVAWFFLIGGILQVIAIFQVSGWGARLWNIFLAVVYIWMGITLLANPLAGVLTLTFVAAILFLASGIAKIFYAFSMTQYRWMMVLSGAISIILAIMIFANYPGSAVVSLGILLAVELLTTGVALMTFGLALKNNPEVVNPTVEV